MSQTQRDSKGNDRRGADAPGMKREQDHLQRWQFAQRIFDLIITSPPDWSLRIGIYGLWGEGKTTVLNFIEDMAQNEEHAVVWFNPWSIRNRNEMWKELSNAVNRTFGTSSWKNRIKQASEKLDTALDVAEDIHWVGKAIKLLGGNTIKGFSDVGRKDVEKALKETLGKSRLIIMIDDVDRADPKLLPYLFLTLREILDLPQCIFILALDPHTVSKALQDVHPGWEDGKTFLEKIIEFPAWLPAPRQKVRDHRG